MEVEEKIMFEENTSEVDGEEAEPWPVFRQELLPLTGKTALRICADAKKVVVIPGEVEDARDHQNWSLQKFVELECCKALRQLSKENQEELMSASRKLLSYIGLPATDTNMRVATRWIQGRITSDCICEDPWLLLRVIAEREPVAFADFRKAMSKRGLAVPDRDELDIVFESLAPVGTKNH